MRNFRITIFVLAGFSFLLTSGCKSSSTGVPFFPEGIDDPNGFSFQAFAYGALPGAQFRFEWTELFRTDTNHFGAIVPSRLVIDPDGSNSPIEPFEVDLSQAEPTNFKPYVSVLILNYLFSEKTVYNPEAWIYAGQYVAHEQTFLDLTVRN